MLFLFFRAGTRRACIGRWHRFRGGWTRPLAVVVGEVVVVVAVVVIVPAVVAVVGGGCSYTGQIF